MYCKHIVLEVKKGINIVIVEHKKNNKYRFPVVKNVINKNIKRKIKKKFVL